MWSWRVGATKTRRLVFSFVLVVIVVTMWKFFREYSTISYSTDIAGSYSLKDLRNQDKANVSQNIQKAHLLQTHVEDMCEQLDIHDNYQETSFGRRFIFVDTRYKVLYCQIPKIACTNWRRTFLVLTGKMNTSDPVSLSSHSVHFEYNHYLTYWRDLTENQKQFALEHYFKFMFVREPFERILSAYRNKFERQSSNEFFHKRYGKIIVKKYRKQQTETNVSDGNDVTFLEFVQYLTDRDRGESLDSHWSKMVDMCHPCSIKYDFIGKYHNLEAEAAHVLQTIDAPSFIKFPNRTALYKHERSEELMTEYYRKIPPKYLKKIMELYHLDFKLFNYTVPQTIRNLTSLLDF